MCHLCEAVGLEGDAARGFLCHRHYHDLLQILKDIDKLYILASDPEFIASTSEPPSDYTKSLPPCSTEVLSLLDARSWQRSVKDVVSPLRVLRAWVWAISDFKGELGVPFYRMNVSQCVTFLMVEMGFVSRSPAVVRFARHIAAARRSLEKAVGDDSFSSSMLGVNRELDAVQSD